MGRKAKKRTRQTHLNSHHISTSATDSDVDVIGDHDDHLLDFKRLRDHGTIDMMLDDFEPVEHDTLSLPGDLCMDDSSIDVLGDTTYDSKIGDSISEPEPCHSDSDLMKSDIFDTSYDPSIGDYSSTFLNGMDHEGMLDEKPPPPLCLQKPAALEPVPQTEPEVKPASTQAEGVVEAACCPPTPLSVTSSSIGGTLPPGSIPISPVLLSNGPMAPAAANTALAHISKIEPGADGKGYVLHLTIPALGLGNVMLSTEGLTFAHPEPKRPPEILPEAPSGASPCAPDANPEDVTVDVDSLCGGEGGGSPVADPAPEHLADPADFRAAGSGPVIVGVTSLAASSQPASNEQPTTTEEEEGAERGTGGEVDRFVICSDGPMVCVLCAFRTECYSAFKSHIICSHPCWRITKKLSKNRLLVERSVRLSSSHANFTTCAPLRKEGGAESGERPAGPPPRKPSLHPRKKQLIERNKRLFRCTECLRLFVFEGSIVNHLMDYHGIRTPYDYIMVSNDHGQNFGSIHRCAHKNCFVTCTTEPELERHRLESHAQVVFRCQICGFAADSTEAIREHARRIHQQQMRDFSD